jgi:SAM-dependent methyltransferase
MCANDARPGDCRAEGLAEELLCDKVGDPPQGLPITQSAHNQVDVRALEQEVGMEKKIYVQYGCGFSAGDGWENFDSSPTLRLERIPVVGLFVSAQFSGNARPFPASVQYGDICKGLPIADNTVCGCYASHVLEHLSLTDFRRALANTFRMLRPGGVFRLIVPDLYERARRYVMDVDRKSPDAAITFLRSTHLGLEQKPRTPLQYLRQMIGGTMHFWMWDEYCMSVELHHAGFVNVRRCQFGDSPDPMFAKVEETGRFFDEDNKITELALEAHKPS